ncbi:Holliday junction resolvase [Candidatus Woesearchaeota archaeon]|nr:Holliday junction resolvase [Candidatus Woesearchaeota archaeon]
MSRKSKGINAERELIHLFWSKGFATVRIAGSGSSRYPSPDVLASNGSRRLAIECKASRNSSKYLTAKEVAELQQFASIFGAEAWIGMRFDDMKWYFLSLEDLKQSGSSFSASVELVKRKGLMFEELIEA